MSIDFLFSKNISDPFKPLANFSFSDANRQKVEILTNKIAEIRSNYSYLPPQYRARKTCRVIIISLLIFGIAVSILAINGKLVSLPESFAQLIKNINWNYVGAGIGVFSFLSCGSGLLIRKACYKKDIITHSRIGKRARDDQWVAASYYRNDMENVFAGYLDTSTLNNEGSGVAFMYAYKDEHGHNSVSMAVILFTPLHMIGAIVYNILRLVLIPLFIIGRLLVEKISKKPIDKADRFYQISDIPKEIVKSLRRILKAPFYALAVMFAALFSFFDPLNGRKIGALLEREWNEGLIRAEGFWSVRGPQSLWKFEGGLSPSKLGKNGFHIAGCWQPIAVVYFEEQKICKCVSLTRAVEPKKGKVYTLLEGSILIQNYNALVDELKSLQSIS